MNALKRLRSLLAMLLLVAAFGALVNWTDRHNALADISRDARNSLDPASVDVLALMPDPIEAVALIPRDLPVATAIETVFARYRRYHPGLSLRFVDPREDLEAAQDLGANLGEIVLRYRGLSERLTRLDEANVTNALARLVRGSARYVTFLSANGERQVGREANHDVSRFAAALEQRGLKVREFDFGAVSDIPANTALVVSASPAAAYSVGELDTINRYVAAGGNLLWLGEPDQDADLVTFARALGVEFLPGTVVDPLGLTKLRNPAYAVSVDRPPHAALDGFKQTVAFPYAAALVAKPNIGWDAAPLATTVGDAWTETGAFEGNVGFDGADEIQGELTLAVALTRAKDRGGEQRVVVIGDGDFLSNTFVDSLGNREFGRRLVEWLAADDALVDIEVDAVPDGLLDLDMWQRMAIFLVFGVLVPVGFLVNGALIAWRRRHA